MSSTTTTTTTTNTSPSSCPSPTQEVKVLCFVTRKPDTTFESFQTYYEKSHIPWVSGMLFQDPDKRPVRYTRNYVYRQSDCASSGDVQGGSGSGSGKESQGDTIPTRSSSFPYPGAEEAFPYDCVTELVFRDVRHRDTCLAEFAGVAQEIRVDEERFLDRGRTVVVFVGERCEGVRGVW